MAPPTQSFHPSQLTTRMTKLPNGAARKPSVPLQDCALQELLQYSCELEGPAGDPRSRVVCEPVLRLFRRCANGLMVETTSWEDIHDS